MVPVSAELPRVFVTARRVYIEWPGLPSGLRTSVVSLGTYLDDVMGWTQRMPDDVVELVQLEPPAEPA